MSKHQTTIDKVTAGVDWITGTLPSGALDYQTWIGDNYYALQQVALGGELIESRRLQGFEGMGFGQTFVGSNEERAMAQFSGERANWAYPYLDHPKVHISRLDIQITVQTDEMDANQGKRCLRAARTNNKNLPANKRRRIDFWLGEGGADTVYIGSASSPIRVRIYNKEAQSEDIRFTRCWRYEVVYRNEVATSVFRSLVLKGDQATSFCLQSVIGRLSERGVVVCGLEHIEAEPLEAIVKPPTDVERKLKWLNKQVKPTIDKLREAGYGTEAARAMGLWIPEETE